MCLGSHKKFKINDSSLPSPLTLKFTFWNIEGFNSKIIGNKLTDSDFLLEVHKADIIGLCETHMHDEVINKLHIPGFVPLHYKNRQKNIRSNTSSGGIAIFAKEYLQKMLQPIHTENQDIIWLKISKQCSNLPKDIYLGTMYFSPLKGEIRNCDKIKNLSEEIINFRREGVDIILQGDFNARTANCTDFVQPDKFDPMDLNLQIEQFHIHPRNSKDKKVDGRGKELLDLCKSLDLNILNGRKTGDIFGDFTSFQWNGNGIVDYLITSQNLYSSVLSLQVGSFMPWISDHCPLHYTFQTACTNIPDIDNNSDLYPLENKFYWDKEATNKFVEGLKSEQGKNRITNILNITDANIMVSELNDALKSVAINSKIKVSKNRVRKNFSDSPWYDSECSNAKKDIIKLAKQIKKDPFNNSIKETLYRLKKSYKKIVRSKKRKYNLEIINQLNCSKKSTKTFWKLLGKLNSKEVESLEETGIPSSSWLRHFKSVLTSKEIYPYPINPSKTGILDFAISFEELNEAAYVLKPGKSPGLDNVSNDMIGCLLLVYPEFILKLFNSILSQGTQITSWTTAIINPIHKKGSKSDIANYRGISLLSCLNKFFTAILSKRLMNLCLKNNILSKEQMGFIPGNRTSDAFIVLNNLVSHYCHSNNKPMYGCFVDFSSAFDSVPRHKLFQKLIDHNITGKFYECIKNMYANDLSCIKVGNKVTGSFQNSLGVKQGDILSPLLFNIFLADFSKIFEDSSNLVKINEKDSLSCIIWADDLLLLSQTEEGLNMMLDKMYHYSKENHLNVNITKTKCMIFNKTGRHLRRTFWYGNVKIDTTREYKYLGLLITPSFNLSTALGNLKDRASRSYNLLKIRLGEHFRKDIILTIYLFEMLVKPILLYGSDYWGCLKLPHNNPIENLYMKFCKDLLGVQKQTTNAGVLLELGKSPLCIQAKKLCIKNWERIAVHKKANLVLEISYEWAEITNVSWALKVKNYLEKIGFLDNFLTKQPQILVHKKILCRELDMFHQSEFYNIEQETAKLRTYSMIKTKIGMEEYLTNIYNITDRISMSKFRLSNHRLMIEVGRHKKIDRQYRKCPFCLNEVEDEIHFLTTCPVYSTCRNSLLMELSIPIGLLITEKQRLFQFLMTDKYAVRLTAKFITNAMLIREFLLLKYRNNT